MIFGAYLSLSFQLHRPKPGPTLKDSYRRKMREPLGQIRPRRMGADHHRSDSTEGRPHAELRRI